MRIQGWELELAEYLTSFDSKPFKWGECDCVTFIADAVVLLCGKDVMGKKFYEDPETARGAYSTKSGAYKLF